jgi:adenylosuccinate lyase
VALSLALGKAAAHAQMEQLCREAIEAGRTLREALITARRQDAVLANALPDALLETLFDPSAQQGDAQRMIDHTLAAWRGL